MLLIVACVAALPLVVGCVAYVHGGFPIVVGEPHPHYYGRPHSSYYCYDCHGYSYFDPYYDYCVNFGFRVDWGHHTPLWRYYTRHRESIVVKMGNYPRYKYKYDYRQGPRYRSPANYNTWRKSEGRTYFSTKEKSYKESEGKSTDVKKSTKTKSTKTKTTTKTKTRDKTSRSRE
jgi:hypothetical protein